jgi:hypothetical protein
MTFEEWMELGINRGWCGPPVCELHDGIPHTWAESEILMMGEDICVSIVRLYPDEETRLEVEDCHAASVWRKEDWCNTQ